MSISDCGSSRKVEALVDPDLCQVTGATKLGLGMGKMGAAIRAHEARRVDEEYLNLIRSEPVFRHLESEQRRRCTEIEMRTVRYVAFRAVNDLSRGHRRTISPAESCPPCGLRELIPAITAPGRYTPPDAKAPAQNSEFLAAAATTAVSWARPGSFDCASFLVDQHDRAGIDRAAAVRVHHTRTHGGRRRDR
ncbi:hypothetical protein [Rhodococcus opacus]|uniref:hypothetical protein n=1 Tax=Rhodococcus opacus TaxID=37919 RepID=UPI0018E483CF|nr:hypothetical protein [Rhodococcus opacus]